MLAVRWASRRARPGTPLPRRAVATAPQTQQRKAGPPPWDPQDVRYTYPMSGGVQAHSFEASSKTHTMDLMRSGYFLFLHVVAFTCGPATFSWDAALLCVGLFYCLQTFGIALSYHRHLTHRSFQLPKPLEYFFAWCGVLNMQGNPIWWAMNHTWHHRYSDTAWDPHTPREGLYTAHCGWFFEQERLAAKIPPAIMSANRNPTEDPNDAEAWPLVPWFYKESPEFYDWLRQTYYWHQIGQVTVLYLLGGWQYVVWGFVIRLLLGIHAVASVNSFAHIWGDAPFKTGDDSKNNFIVAVLASGEGNHNNHHAFPRSAKHGLFENQFDPTWAVISLLEQMGLAWDVQLPSDAQIAAKLRAAEDEPTDEVDSVMASRG